MDGTLTIAVHDFEQIRKALNLPPDTPILEAISHCPKHEQIELNNRLDELEIDYARMARQQPGAETLLSALSNAGHSLGILTRNSVKLAEITLEACGLDIFFQPQDIIGRGCCTPKPSPAGVHYLLDAWNANKKDAVMIGDYRFDLEAGYAAGITTVHFDVAGEIGWPDITDHRFQNFDEIIAATGL